MSLFGIWFSEHMQRTNRSTSRRCTHTICWYSFTSANWTRTLNNSLWTINSSWHLVNSCAYSHVHMFAMLWFHSWNGNTRNASSHFRTTSATHIVSSISWVRTGHQYWIQASHVYGVCNSIAIIAFNTRNLLQLWTDLFGIRVFPSSLDTQCIQYTGSCGTLSLHRI